MARGYRVSRPGIGGTAVRRRGVHVSVLNPKRLGRSS